MKIPWNIKLKIWIRCYNKVFKHPKELDKHFFKANPLSYSNGSQIIFAYCIVFLDESNIRTMSI
jgi:hypothetical protein